MIVREQPHADVLIIGAGPTGLTLATVLARYGVRVRIVEKKSRLSRHSKATNLMQRTQELLSALDLTGPLNAIGSPMTRLMVHAYGTCLGPRTMHLTESPFADVLLIGQHHFERVAADNLTRLGVPIEFQTTLASLRQEPDGVVATLQTDDGLAEARFPFVVGCDGAAGTTRSFTKHDFTPTRTGVAIRQVDARLSWRRPSTMDQMWLFYVDRGFAVIVPLPGGVHRLIAVEPRGAFPEREPTLEEMQARMRTITGDAQLTLTDPAWFSYSDLAMGLAPGFRDGRIFLAGDVGNPVLPNGGQGMNTGIGDAFNLGWKLAAVLRHGAPTALLDTYTEERHALRRALQKAQYGGLKYTTISTPRAMQAAIRALAEPLLDFGGELAMARTFSELRQHTGSSCLTLDLCRRAGVRGGERARDEVVTLDGRTIRLYQLIYRGHWTLLGFAGRDERANADEVRAAITRLGREDLASFIVLTTAHAAADSTDIFDLDQAAHRAYGVRRPTLYLFRPDGHVAVRLRPRQSPQLKAYLDRWLPDGRLAFSRGREDDAPEIAGPHLAAASERLSDHANPYAAASRFQKMTLSPPIS